MGRPTAEAEIEMEEAFAHGEEYKTEIGQTKEKLVKLLARLGIICFQIIRLRNGKNEIFAYKTRRRTKDLFSLTAFMDGLTEDFLDLLVIEDKYNGRDENRRNELSLTATDQMFATLVFQQSCCYKAARSEAIFLHEISKRVSNRRTLSQKVAARTLPQAMKGISSRLFTLAEINNLIKLVQSA